MWCTPFRLLVTCGAMHLSAVTALSQRADALARGVPVAADFSLVTSVRELSSGDLLVADAAENLLVHVTANGAKKPIARVGGGPGEYRRIGWIFELASDSSLVVDSFTGRLLILFGFRVVRTYSEHEMNGRTTNGEIFGADSIGNVLELAGSKISSQGYAVHRAGSDYIVVRRHHREGGTPDSVAILQGPGGVGQRLFHRPGRLPLLVAANPLLSEESALLFPDGWIAVARQAPYRVDWRAPDGRWTRGTPIPDTLPNVDTREKCFALRRIGAVDSDSCDPGAMEGWPERLPAFPSPNPSIGPPVLFATPDGSVAVTRARTATQQNPRFDVVNRRGALVRRVGLDENQFVVGFGRRGIYVVHLDEDDVQTVYRHPWP